MAIQDSAPEMSWEQTLERLSQKFGDVVYHPNGDVFLDIPISDGGRAKRVGLTWQQAKFLILNR